MQMDSSTVQAIKIVSELLTSGLTKKQVANGLEFEATREEGSSAWSVPVVTLDYVKTVVTS